MNKCTTNMSMNVILAVSSEQYLRESYSSWFSLDGIDKNSKKDVLLLIN